MKTWRSLTWALGLALMAAPSPRAAAQAPAKPASNLPAQAPARTISDTEGVQIVSGLRPVPAAPSASQPVTHLAVAPSESPTAPVPASATPQAPFSSSIIVAENRQQVGAVGAAIPGRQVPGSTTQQALVGTQV